jgi:plastocyanin/uncharacterized membrane protein YozB (DUF420 family)
MNGRGFLGTNASLVSDLSLVMGVLVALTLTVGVVMAVRKKYQIHRWIQSTAVVLNVVQVLLVMVGSFTRSAAPGIPARLGENYYTIALAHGLLGLTTLLLGVFIAIRANELLPPFLGFLRFHNFKLFMRTAYCLYMLSTALGVGVYVIWYGPRPEEPIVAPEQTTMANEIVVPMKGFAFNPETLVVPVGSTIIWVNQDGAPHTATADDGHRFQSDLLATGQSFRLTVGELGEMRYFCELHGSAGGVGMSGTVRVVAAGDVAVAAAAPAAPALAYPTAEPVQVVDQRRLPDAAFQGIHQLLVEGPATPARQGFAVGLKNEAREMERHARLLIQSQTQGDLPGIRRHAEHIYNLVAGARDAAFGDLDKDGHAQNAGDGFGLLTNGDQAGYIRATRDAANLAGSAADATPSIKVHAAHVRTTTDNMQAWALEAREVALELTRARELVAVDRPASRLINLAKWLAVGNDVDGDGEISPVVGEGGALVAYEHAQFMAGSVIPRRNDEGSPRQLLQCQPKDPSQARDDSCTTPR